MQRPLIGLVVNPKAARNRRRYDCHREYEALMSDRGLLSRTEGEEDLSTSAKEFFEAGIDVLAVAGGDGTLHATLNAFMPVYGASPLPPILILQAGTINNMSSEIGMRRSGIKVLHEILNGKTEGQFQMDRRMLMRVNDDYGFLYGSGFPARLVERYYAAPRQNALTALFLVGRSIFQAALRPSMAKDLFGRLRAHLMIDGHSREEKDLLFILASTIFKVGLNFKPCHLALNNEKRFHLMTCSSRLKTLVPKIHLLYLGQPLNVKGCIDAQADEVLIELDDPLPYIVDGELKPEAKRHAIKSDRAIRFIVDVKAP